MIESEILIWIFLLLKLNENEYEKISVVSEEALFLPLLFELDEFFFEFSMFSSFDDEQYKNWASSIGSAVVFIDDNVTLKFDVSWDSNGIGEMFCRMVTSIRFFAFSILSRLYPDISTRRSFAVGDTIKDTI